MNSEKWKAIIKVLQYILTIIAGFVGGAASASAASVFGLY